MSVLPEIDFNGDLENLGATGFSVPRGRVSETFQILDKFHLDSRAPHDQIWRRISPLRRTEFQRQTWSAPAFQVNTCVFVDDNTLPHTSNDHIVNELANFTLATFLPWEMPATRSAFTFNNNFGFFARMEFRLRPKFDVPRVFAGNTSGLSRETQPAFEFRR